MVDLYSDFKREIETKPTGKTAVTHFIINGIEQVWRRVCGQVRGRLSVHTSTKRFYRKGTRRTRKNKEQRTNTKRKAGIFWAVPSVGGTFWAVSSVGGTFWAVSRVSGTLLAVLRVGGTFWRYLELAVFFSRKR